MVIERVYLNYIKKYQNIYILDKNIMFINFYNY